MLSNSLKLPVKMTNNYIASHAFLQLWNIYKNCFINSKIQILLKFTKVLVKNGISRFFILIFCYYKLRSQYMLVFFKYLDCIWVVPCIFTKIKIRHHKSRKHANIIKKEKTLTMCDCLMLCNIYMSKLQCFSSMKKSHLNKPQHSNGDISCLLIQSYFSNSQNE